MAISKVKALRAVLSKKRTTSLFRAGASVPFFSSLGKIEGYVTSKDITEEDKRLVMSVFYYIAIRDNLILAEYTKKGELENHLDSGSSVINQYSRFTFNCVESPKLRNSRVSLRRTNIFTMNYDLLLGVTVKENIESNPKILFNGETNGYTKGCLSTENLNKTMLYTRASGNYANESPTISLVKCHGSVNRLNKRNFIGRDGVLVNSSLLGTIRTAEKAREIWSELRNDMVHGTNFQRSFTIEILEDVILGKPVDGLIGSPTEVINCSGEKYYNQLQGINEKISEIRTVLPTKGKSQSILTEGQYSSMFRFLSYELEKEQSVLTAFGSSFLGEYMTDIVQKSLNNPNLLVFIFCYKGGTRGEIMNQSSFGANAVPPNIVFITLSGFIMEQAENEEETPLLLGTNQIRSDDSAIVTYSEEVSVYNNKDAVIDFEAFNRITEGNFSERYIGSQCTEIVDDGE